MGKVIRRETTATELAKSSLIVRAQAYRRQLFAEFDRVTARTNDHRRVGYDFNFNCPKSVSVVHALTNDDRILSSFRESVTETMRQIESEMKTRVRIDGAQEDRRTGNMVWGEFIHFTARPVEGRPDPHLHAHCYAFNATYDGVEDKWKAGQFQEAMMAMLRLFDEETEALQML